MSTAPSDLDTRVSASIGAWKSKLLDLTRRNRLLNFKATRVSTVTVVDEQPAEVFRALYIDEEAMRFRPIPDKEVPTQPADTQELAVWEDPAADVIDGAEFVQYEAEMLPDHHTDEWLQTTAIRDNLDRSLRRLEENGRLTIEEQGVNTLFLTLGMLHYKESESSEEVYRAPLVLLPVELARASARSGYTLTAADDEPMVNPALTELLRQIHNVALPTLPDAQAMGTDYDLQSLFAATLAAMAGRPGWKVTNDIHLSQLSFQKFVMFKDLEKNVQAIAQHRLIRQLVGRTGDNITGLPSEIRDLDLDQAFPPETTFQVVDADSSQLRAMTACHRGYDLVIEGPPGTGKSQTITNLIAQTLAAGKSVLFVAEKMAALSVVHRRLVNAGLGEFCLELHSSKSNKRTVMQDLANTINASLQSAGQGSGASERLPDVRATLGNYVHALHEPFGVLDLSPFQGYGKLARVRHAAAVTLKRAIDDVTRKQLAQAVRELTDLALSATEVGLAAEHPWRDSQRTFYTENDLHEVRDAAQATLTAVERVMQLASTVSSACGLPPIGNTQDARVAADVAGVMARSPGAPLAVLQSDAWNAPPSGATRIVQTGREYSRLRQQLKGWFTVDALGQDHARDIEYVEAKKSGFFGFLAFLDGRYRAIMRRWKTYRLTSYTRSILEQAQELKSVDQYRAALAELHARSSAGSELFGAVWRETESDWDTLERYIAWVVEFRRACVQHKLSDDTIKVAAQSTPDVSVADELTVAVRALTDKLQTLAKLIAWPDGYLLDAPFAEADARLQALRDNVVLGPRWAAFERNRQTVATGLAAEMLVHGMSGSIEFGALPAVFERAFYMKWLSVAVQARAPLERFQSLTHEQRVREFQTLDQQVLRDNRTLLTRKLRNQAQERLKDPEVKNTIGFLQQQMNKQRAIAPLRQIMAKSGSAVRALKPCFMMSPLTVAQLLDGSKPSFDVIIFDEASQLPPEDAIGAIARGQQLVVVGDPKQLPPTNFFAVTTGQVQAPLDDDGNPIYDDAESILEQYMGAGVPMSRLKWHYRSAHESLITFSNVLFYDAELYTFPCIDQPCAGVRFELVTGGEYEGKGLNAKEAKRVVDDVVAFATEQLARPEAERLTLGVGTFNLRQQLGIQDELERRRQADPSIEEFFQQGGPEPFFVKNLENIQGDERDVIFLSVTYGPGSDGRIRNNFGPLNSQNGWRRLNVLVTRARKHLRVFASMHGDQINVAAAQSRGPQLLRDFLVYAEHNRLSSPLINAMATAESPFEQEVCSELAGKGYRVISQVGSAGYRVDLGVLADQTQGRFLCGIECDGVAYHSAETARDRDRLRQQVLEARGWIIHRVWSTDWFRDRPGQIDRLVRLIEADRARDRTPRAQASAPPDAPARASKSIPENTPAVIPYKRPVAQPYVEATDSQTRGPDILIAPESHLVEALRCVVERESPVHEMDVYARVAGFWDKRLGARIQQRIEAVAGKAVRKGLFRKRGYFLWNASDTLTLRSREGRKVSADRIPPEELAHAVREVLKYGHSFPRQALINEVRAVLGFSRTGDALQEAISPVVDQLISANVLGEGSGGLQLRSIGT